jgi:hypothetical protein
VPTVGVIPNRVRRYDVLQAGTENWVRGDHTHRTDWKLHHLRWTMTRGMGARASGDTRFLHSVDNGPAPCLSTQE